MHYENIPRGIAGALRPMSLALDEEHLRLTGFIQRVNPENRYLFRDVYMSVFLDDGLRLQAEIKLFGHAFLEPLSPKTLP